MVKPTEYRLAQHRAARRTAVRRSRRHALPEALVRTQFIEIFHVLAEHPQQLSLAENDHVIEALSPYASKESLAMCVHV